MNPRMKRLAADYRYVVEGLARCPRIELVETEGTPPEAYRLRYKLQGLKIVDEEHFEIGSEFDVEIFLPLDYPRRPPFCRMRTPTFHPNIDPQKICIGDHWSAGQRLIQLIIRIGEMITFQSYNVKSPLNAAAAAWVEEHLDHLPLEQVDLNAGT